MRRAVAISLLLLFSWTLITPFAGSGFEANHPTCCCSHGRCHCRMHSMNEKAERSGKQSGFTTVAQKCPCCPASARVVHSASNKPEAAAAPINGSSSQPMLATQTGSVVRNSFLRSYPKRGPPALLG